MDEEKTTPADGAATEPADSSSENWGDITFSDVEAEDAGEEQGTESEEGTGEKADADQQKSETGETGAEESAEDKPGEQPQKEADQLFELKHLGEVRQVKKDEAIILAQKGLDYDHIRQERDTAKDKLTSYEEFLKELAAPQNLSIEDLMDNTRAQLLINREKSAGRTMDQDTARARVKLERERNAFDSAKEQEAQEKSKEDRASKARQQGYIEFMKERTDANGKLTVDISKIPQEVWARVSEKESLSSAYAKYENKVLTEKYKVISEENERLKKYQENKERSTGSRMSAGNSSADANFDKTWYNGE